MRVAQVGHAVPGGTVQVFDAVDVEERGALPARENNRLLAVQAGGMLVLDLDNLAGCQFAHFVSILLLLRVIARSGSPGDEAISRNERGDCFAPRAGARNDT